MFVAIKSKSFIHIAFILLPLLLLYIIPTTSQENISVNQATKQFFPVWHPNYHTTKSKIYHSGKSDPNELKNVQCPIPMKDRVKNYTGIQCVFSSLETLARWAECKALLEPIPLTQRPGCKSYSNPYDAEQKLKKFGFTKYIAGKKGLMFENIYRNREDGIRLIKKAMRDGRGALFGVPGHAMVIVHYDEDKNVMKYIDNSDYSLKIHTMTVSRFKRVWDGWVLVIYSDPDLFPQKARRIKNPLNPNNIPVINRNGGNIKFPPNYIPLPITISP